MNQDSRISLWQVVILLCLSRMFSVMTMCMVYTSFNIQEMFYGALLAIPLAFVVFLPGGLLFQKRPRLLLDNRAKWLWMTFYLLLALGWLLMTLLHLDFFLGNAVFPQAPSIALLWPAVLAGCWCAYQGLEGLARYGSILFVFFAISVLLLICTAAPEMSATRLDPITTVDWGNIWAVAVNNLFQNPELIFLPLLAPRLAEGKLLKAGVWYCLLSGGLVALLFGLVCLTFGDFTTNIVYPVYSLSAAMQVGFLQRLDAVYMAIWVMLALFRIAILLWFAKGFLLHAAPKRSPLSLIFLLGGVLLGVSWILSGSLLSNRLAYNPWVMGGTVAVSALVFPIGTWLCRRKEGKGK